MSEAQGIKEISELIEGLKIIGVDVKKVLADGKIGVSDLPVLLDLLQKFSVLVDALKGLDQVPAEVKDISGDEAQALVAKVLEVAAAIKAA